MNCRFFSPPRPHTPAAAASFKHRSSSSRLSAHNAGNDCTVTIDGTDFRIPQKGIAKKGDAFASHKYAGKSTLCYELGVDILAGNLVWIQGPYPAGKYTNIKIFNKVLCNFLETGERVEANKGYRGHPDKIVIATLSDCVGMRCPSLKKRMFLRHKSLVCFYSCCSTFEYLHDMQAKKAAPIVSCRIDLKVSVT